MCMRRSLAHGIPEKPVCVSVLFIPERISPTSSLFLIWTLATLFLFLLRSYREPRVYKEGDAGEIKRASLFISNPASLRERLHADKHPFTASILRGFGFFCDVCFLRDGPTEHFMDLAK